MASEIGGDELGDDMCGVCEEPIQDEQASDCRQWRGLTMQPCCFAAVRCNQRQHTTASANARDGEQFRKGRPAWRAKARALVVGRGHSRLGARKALQDHIEG